MTDTDLNTRYQQLLADLAAVSSDEMKRHIIHLIETGFSEFDPTADSGRSTT